MFVVSLIALITGMPQDSENGAQSSFSVSFQLYRINYTNFHCICLGTIHVHVCDTDDCETAIYRILHCNFAWNFERTSGSLIGNSRNWCVWKFVRKRSFEKKKKKKKKGIEIEKNCHIFIEKFLFMLDIDIYKRIKNKEFTLIRKQNYSVVQPASIIGDDNQSCTIFTTFAHA